MSTVEPPPAGVPGSPAGPPGATFERDSGMVVLISTAVLVFVAVALAVAAFFVHQSGSDVQANADRIERVTRQHATATANASRDLLALHASADHTYTTLGAFMAAYQAQLASQNHAIDIANGAAVSFNTVHVNISDALKPEAQAAVADAEAKAAVIHAVLVQVKQAFTALQQASG